MGQGDRPGIAAAPNQTLHTDRGRILVSRDTTPLQRPRRVNCVVELNRSAVVGSS